MWEVQRKREGRSRLGLFNVGNTRFFHCSLAMKSLVITKGNKIHNSTEKFREFCLLQRFGYFFLAKCS